MLVIGRLPSRLSDLILGVQIINCRLAMLGFVAALGAELAQHKGLLQQFKIAPLPIAATFFLFTGSFLTQHTVTLAPLPCGVCSSAVSCLLHLVYFTSEMSTSCFMSQLVCISFQVSGLRLCSQILHKEFISQWQVVTVEIEIVSPVS